ncbi:hypothetical protein [Lentzea sp. NPDC004782]|uniref:hypothetical protein n=1 Tax=Lentzea sp. NPDC004782 TaxID=3154458 RepID=UPI0033BED67D
MPEYEKAVWRNEASELVRKFAVYPVSGGVETEESERQRGNFEFVVDVVAEWRARQDAQGSFDDVDWDGVAEELVKMAPLPLVREELAGGAGPDGSGGRVTGSGVVGGGSEVVAAPRAKRPRLSVLRPAEWLSGEQVRVVRELGVEVVGVGGGGDGFFNAVVVAVPWRVWGARLDGLGFEPSVLGLREAVAGAVEESDEAGVSPEMAEGIRTRGWWGDGAGDVVPSRVSSVLDVDLRVVGLDGVVQGFVADGRAVSSGQAFYLFDSGSGEYAVVSSEADWKVSGAGDGSRLTDQQIIALSTAYYAAHPDADVRQVFAVIRRRGGTGDDKKMRPLVHKAKGTQQRPYNRKPPASSNEKIDEEARKYLRNNPDETSAWSVVQALRAVGLRGEEKRLTERVNRLMWCAEVSERYPAGPGWVKLPEEEKAVWRNEASELVRKFAVYPVPGGVETEESGLQRGDFEFVVDVVAGWRAQANAQGVSAGVDWDGVAQELVEMAVAGQQDIDAGAGSSAGSGGDVGGWREEALKRYPEGAGWEKLSDEGVRKWRKQASGYVGKYAHYPALVESETAKDRRQREGYEFVVDVVAKWMVRDGHETFGEAYWDGMARELVGMALLEERRGGVKGGAGPGSSGGGVAGAEVVGESSRSAGSAVVRDGSSAASSAPRTGGSPLRVPRTPSPRRSASAHSRSGSERRSGSEQLRRGSPASSGRLTPSSGRRLPSWTAPWVDPADTIRMERARRYQPEMVGDPDFSGLRTSLKDQIKALKEDVKKWEAWIDTTFSDAKLKQLGRSLDGVLEFRDDFEIGVKTTGIGPPLDAVDRSADLKNTEKVEEDKDVSADQITSTPLNPLQGTIPAGPVNISFAIRGAIGSASERRTATKETALESVGVSQKDAQVTESRHDVRYRLTIKPPKPSEPVEWSKLVKMTLSWPTLDDTAVSVASESSRPSTPLTPVGSPDTLAYPDFTVETDARARAIAHARFESVLKALTHVRFAGIDAVFSGIKARLDLSPSDPAVEALKGWLDSLGVKHGTSLVTGGIVSATFNFSNHRKPIKIMIGREKLPEHHRRHSSSGSAQTSKRSVEHVRSLSQEHSVAQSGTQEAAYDLGVSFGEAVAEMLGAKLEAGLSYGRSNENLAEQMSGLRHELTESVTGEFIQVPIVFPFVVTTEEVGGQSHLAPPDTGRELPIRLHRRRPSPLTAALHIDGAALLLLAPEAADDAPVREEGDSSGLKVEEVPDYSYGQGRFPELIREGIIDRVVQELYARELVSSADDARLVQQRLRGFLKDPKAVFGGDPKRFPLRGMDKDLFFRGTVDKSLGRYKGVAPRRDLAGFVSASKKMTIAHDRRRSGGFKIAVEGEAGIADLSGEIETTRTYQQRGQLIEAVEEEQAWTGGVPVHLYEFPAEIEVRTGTDWAHLDEPIEWREQSSDTQESQSAGLRPTIAAKVEIAVRQRPGKEAEIGPHDAEAETPWIDADAPTTLIPRFRRPADLPKRFEVDSVVTIADMGSETANMLLVPESNDLQNRLMELAKMPVLGKAPVPLGGTSADYGDQDASRKALEHWTSWQSRQGRLGLAEGPGDELTLENYNDGGRVAKFELGSRRITGTAKLSTTYGNARILRIDPAHKFSRTVVTHTTLESGEERQTSPTATFSAGAGLGDVAKAQSKAVLAYQTESKTIETSTVVTRLTVSWVEHSYLIEFDAQHLLSTSAHHSWTDPFGGHHDEPVVEKSRRKHVPQAVKLWVPASEIPTIGVLSSHDLDHNLRPEDREAYRAQNTEQPEPVEVSETAGQATVADQPTADHSADRIADLDLALGIPEPLRPDMTLKIMEEMRAQLREYEQTIKDAGIRGQYARLHDEMVQAFGTRLELNGPTTLTNMLNGGVPLFGERLGESGKLEQMIVVRATRTDSGRLSRLREFGIKSEVTTIRKKNRGSRSNWSKAAGVALPPTMPEWIGSKLTDDKLTPKVALSGEVIRGTESRSVSEHMVTYEWSGEAARHSNGLMIDVQARPWARSGMYRKHVPGLRQDPVHDVHDLAGFALPSAIQTSVPSVLGPHQAPLASVDTPLSESTKGAELPEDATIQALPFQAQQLHQYLIELVPGLNARRAYTLLASTTSTQLTNHFTAGLSPDGYVVDVGSRSVATAKISFDLGKRELLREIPNAKINKGTSTTNSTHRLDGQKLSADAGLFGGPLGKGIVEKTLVDKRHKPPEGEPVVAKAQPGKAYLVRAELLPTVVLAHRDGKISEPFKPAPDGSDGFVWLQVDEAGARALGLTVPSAEPDAGAGASTAETGAGLFAEPVRHVARLASTYIGATRGLDRLALSREELTSWVGDVVAMSSSALEQFDLLPGTSDLLRQVDGVLRAEQDPDLRDRLRTLVNDAVLAATLAPVRDGGQAKASSGGHRAVRPISPDRLAQLLSDLTEHFGREENPFTTAGSLVHGISYQPGSSLPARLAVLATVNLDDAVRQKVLRDPLFARVLANPASVTEALFASAGHEPRHFRTTSLPAAINMALRVQTPTIVPMLHAGEAVVKAVEDGLAGTSIAFRTQIDRVLGRTQGQRVQDRVIAARQEFAAIREQAETIVSQAHQDPASWNELTSRWSRTMQKLAATDLTGPLLPVLTPEAVPGHPHLSAIVTTPRDVDHPWRRHARADVTAYLAALGTVLAPDPDGSRWGSEYRADAESLQEQLSSWLTTAQSQYDFWSWLAAGAGQVLQTAGDAVHIRAVRVAGRDVIAVGDPRRSAQDLVSLPQFSTMARRKSWTAAGSLFAGDLASEPHDKLSLDLDGHTAARIDAGVFIGADLDSVISNAARYLPAENGVFGVVLDQAGVLGPKDVEAVLRAAGWEPDEEVRLFTGTGDSGTLATELASRLRVPVSRSDGDRWRRHWPDGRQTGGAYGLDVPGTAASQFGLTAAAPRDSVSAPRTREAGTHLLSQLDEVEMIGRAWEKLPESEATALIERAEQVVARHVRNPPAAGVGTKTDVDYGKVVRLVAYRCYQQDHGLLEGGDPPEVLAAQLTRELGLLPPRWRRSSAARGND